MLEASGVITSTVPACTLYGRCLELDLWIDCFAVKDNWRGLRIAQRILECVKHPILVDALEGKKCYYRQHMNAIPEVKLYSFRKHS